MKIKTYLKAAAAKIKKIYSNYITDRFHSLYYYTNWQTWSNTYFMGIRTKKCPLDLWIYQEIIFDIKPDLIVECGTASGGSALYMAALLDYLKVGQIITIDPDQRPKPHHPRITYLTGLSTDQDIIEQVKNASIDKKTIMVILDSDHSKKNVLREMHTYHKLVTPGSYLIVEDSHINSHPVAKEFGPGPTEALEEFLKENNDFEIDKNREKFLLTFNPNGYLKKKSNSAS